MFIHTYEKSITRFPSIYGKDDIEKVFIGIGTKSFDMTLEKNSEDNFFTATTYVDNKVRMSGSIPCNVGTLELLSLIGDHRLRFRTDKSAFDYIEMIMEFAEVEGENGITDVVLVEVKKDSEKNFYYLSDIWGVPVILPNGIPVKIRRSNYETGDL